MSRVRISVACCLLFVCCEVQGADKPFAAPKTAFAPSAAPRVVDAGKLPNDARLNPPRTYDDAYHPWAPPANKAEWEKARERIREQVLVSNGLWPMPPMPELKPVIHGKIDRGDYTIEKVFFASLPGHYVCGSLYRPKNANGKVPGVLCPHGHWKNGRFYESTEKLIAKDLSTGAEKFKNGGTYPLQARMAGLARLGCVVFHYDMIGYADSQQIAHREGFKDPQAELWQQNFMGLQTYNSIRALDFILSLPDVDATRIGVTGASGGGTQTFMLCAIDPRPAAAFPAVMVSTAMQGGCICENCSLMRLGLNNIAITALFAPKPLAMSGADDWTKEIETKGLPELKAIYGFYGKPENVYAKAHPEFPHNYNQVSREMMYTWFNKHLKLGHSEPIAEKDFQPVPVAELSVFNAEHPLPSDAVDAAGVRKYLQKVSQDQFAALLPHDAKGVAEYKRVVGTAARIMLDEGVPPADNVGRSSPYLEEDTASYRLYRVSATRKDSIEQIPVIGVVPSDFNGTAILWLDGQGKSHLFKADGSLQPGVQDLLLGGYGVVSADVFLTGEFLPDNVQSANPKVNNGYAGYTFCYNRTLLANRVRDILTVIGGMHKNPAITKVHLMGTGEAGVWALLARSLAGDKVQECVVDLQGFGFNKVKSMSDANLLPGALKYGGIGGLAALAAPAPITIAGTQDVPADELKALNEVYAAAKGKVTLQPAGLTNAQAADAMLKLLKK